jgi:MFS family permease
MTTARRSLAGFMSAVGVSDLGTRMSFLAVPWFVLSLTGSTVDMGVIALAATAPYAAAQALGGPLVDVWGVWRMSVITDVLATLCMGAVPVLEGLHLLSLAGLGSLLAAAGLVRGLADSARAVMVPGVGTLAALPLERSSGWFDGVSRGAALVGAPLAGVLGAWTSAINVLVVDAGTFLASALLVGLLVPRRVEPPARERRSGHAEERYLQSIKNGLRYLRTDSLLLSIALMVLITNFLDQANAAVFVPTWAHNVMHSSIVLGLVGGIFGAGAILGNLLTTWLGPRLPRRVSFGLGYALAGAPRYAALALGLALSPVVAVFLIGGMGAGGINPILGAVEYERVPRHLQARVLGALNAVAWVGIPFGSLVGGWAVARVGLAPALSVAGALYGLTTLMPFVFPVWRGMERVVGSDAPGA